MAAASGIEKHLDAGEKLLWSGQPAQGLAVQAADFFLIPFSLVWSGMAFYFIFLGVSSGASFPFLASQLLFGIFGFYFSVGRFALDAWYRACLSYAVTDRRVILAGDAPFAGVRSLPLGALSHLDVAESANRVGTVQFSPSQSLFEAGGLSMWQTSLGRAPMFFRIADARAVASLIAEAKARATRA